MGAAAAVSYTHLDVYKRQGLGKMGLSHAAIASAHPDVDMVAVCDTSSMVLNAFNKFSSVKTYSDFEKMINSENPEFVIIATPTKYHYPCLLYTSSFKPNIDDLRESPAKYIAQKVMQSEQDGLLIVEPNIKEDVYKRQEYGVYNNWFKGRRC